MIGFASASELPPEPESNIPNGKMYHIAVMAWFKSNGNPIPISFKFQDDAGEIQSVRDILIKYEEDKNYSGIPSKEFGCEAIIGGFIRQFKMIFYAEACKWVMLI